LEQDVGLGQQSFPVFRLQGQALLQGLQSFVVQLQRQAGVRLQAPLLRAARPLAESLLQLHQRIQVTPHAVESPGQLQAVARKGRQEMHPAVIGLLHLHRPGFHRVLQQAEAGLGSLREVLAREAAGPLGDGGVRHLADPLIVGEEVEAVAAGQQAQLEGPGSQARERRPLDEVNRILVEYHVEAEGALVGDQEVVEVLLIYVPQHEARRAMRIGRVEIQRSLQHQVAVFVRAGHPGEAVGLEDLQLEGTLAHEAAVVRCLLLGQAPGLQPAEAGLPALLYESFRVEPGRSTEQFHGGQYNRRATEAATATAAAIAIAKARTLSSRPGCGRAGRPPARSFPLPAPPPAPPSAGPWGSPSVPAPA
jgi:hypothetical protein